MISVIPCPKSYKKLPGHLQFFNFRMVIKKCYENAITLFFMELNQKLQLDEQKEAYTFEFEINKSMDKEEYMIHMDPNITYVEGGSELAFFNATRTLSQLLLLNTSGKQKCLEGFLYHIEDCSKQKERSFYVDESHHFLGVETIKKTIQLLSLLKIYDLKWNIGKQIAFRKIAHSYDENKPYYAYHEIKEIQAFATFYHVHIHPVINREIFKDSSSDYIQEYKTLFKTDKVLIENDQDGSNDSFFTNQKLTCFHLPYCVESAKDFFQTFSFQLAIFINQWEIPYVFEFYLNPRLEIYAQKLWNPFFSVSYEDFLKQMDDFYPILRKLNFYYATETYANPIEKEKLLGQLKMDSKAEYLASLYEKKAR